MKPQRPTQIININAPQEGAGYQEINVNASTGRGPERPALSEMALAAFALVIAAGVALALIAAAIH